MGKRLRLKPTGYVEVSGPTRFKVLAVRRGEVEIELIAEPEVLFNWWIIDCLPAAARAALDQEIVQGLTTIGPRG